MSKSPSLRRIQADVRELALDPSDQYHAAPLESDMFEWHFTIKGPKGTDFEGGIYHGRILLPPDYPFKPPHLIFLTPSGRFETNTKVCLSFSAYHPELWQPAWGIRLILEALISFLPTPADGAIGALDWSSKERKRLAKKSIEFCCPQCGKIANLIPKPKERNQGGDDVQSPPQQSSRFAKEILELRRLQMLEHKKDKDDTKEENNQENTKTDEEEAQQEQTQTSLAAKEEDSTSQYSNDINNDTIKTSFDNSDENKDNNNVEQESNVDEETTTKIPVSDGNVDVEETATSKSPEAQTAPSISVETEAVETTTATTPATAPAATTMTNTNGFVQSLVDPLLQLIIIVLSGICYLLLRKVQALCADLQALEG